VPSFDFTVTKLIGSNFLVKGQDVNGNEGQVKLTSESWAAVLHARRSIEAQDMFDAAVREFFQPLTNAADKARGKDVKDWGTVTIFEDSPGIKGQGIELDDDGVLLRILDEERGDLLVWIDEHTLGAIEE
jgi:hypothetical protein